MNLLAIKFGSRHDASKSFFRGRDGNIGRAHAAADEGKHEDNSGDPKIESHGKVVIHGPSEVIKSVCKRTGADVVVLGEHHRASDDSEDELNEARCQGAVHGAYSCSVSPCTYKHEERVKSDDFEGSAQNHSDYSELRATFLAVHVTVIGKIIEGLKEISGHLFVVPVEFTNNLQVNIPGTATEGTCAVCGCG